jgi:hypothetical protein
MAKCVVITGAGAGKASGIGRECGIEGIQEFLESKVVAWRI